MIFIMIILYVFISSFLLLVGTMFIPLGILVVLELFILFPFVSWLLERKNILAKFFGTVVGTAAIIGTVLFAVLTVSSVLYGLFAPKNHKTTAKKHGVEYGLWANEFPKSNNLFVYFFPEKALVGTGKVSLNFSTDYDKLSYSNFSIKNFLYFRTADSNSEHKEMTPDGFEISVKRKDGKNEKWLFIKKGKIGKSYWRIAKNAMLEDNKLPDVFNRKTIKNFDELKDFIKTVEKENHYLRSFSLYKIPL